IARLSYSPWCGFLIELGGGGYEQSESRCGRQRTGRTLSWLFDLRAWAGSSGTRCFYTELGVLPDGGGSLHRLDRPDRQRQQELVAWRDRPRAARYAILG